ncbi:MAG: hypothetical protein M1839_006176 [Geoglossum umbratile]|nr:MAG: hypothetical protein M1839_006176 [Geoglossum umbratile]
MSSPHGTSAAPTLPPRRRGGRPRKAPNAAPEKRKAEAELSQHPRSVKRRNRLANQSATDREVERAVQRDRANKNNALKRYLKSDQYQSLPENQKGGARTEFLIQWIEANNRRSDSAAQLKVRLSWYDDVVTDDVGSDWEDAAEEFDERMDAIHRIDEAVEGYTPMEVDGAQFKEMVSTAERHRIKRSQLAIYGAMRATWLQVAVSFYRKLDAADGGDTSINTFSFSKLEIAVWQVIAMSVGKFRRGWYDLPGPATMWPDDLDFDTIGWTIPSMEPRHIALCNELYEMFLGDREPTDKMVDLTFKFFIQFAD